MMTTAESPDRSTEPTTAPDSDEHPPSSDGWLDRLRAAVGLKPPASIRQDLAAALANDDYLSGFSPEERAMLSNILRLREVRVDDVMVPRADIDAVDVTISLGALWAAFQDSGHSRMPVYRETLDDPVGFVHIKDLMGHIARAAGLPPAGDGAGAGLDLRTVDLAKGLAETNLVRDMLFVPPSMPVTALLAGMQASRMQMALVIDEYGGTDGLVSLEDVVELVVGDIEDEHDDDDGPMIVSDGDGAFLADARADLDEAAEVIGPDFAADDKDEDIDTIGGLVFSLLGRIPVRGELVAVPHGFELEILDADPRRLKRLRIRRRPEGAPRVEARRRARPPQGAEDGT